MKKILLFVLLLAVLCFTACDDKGNDASTELGKSGWSSGDSHIKQGELG